MVFPPLLLRAAAELVLRIRRELEEVRRRARSFAEWLEANHLLHVVSSCPSRAYDEVAGVDGWLAEMASLHSIVVYGVRAVRVAVGEDTARIEELFEDAVTHVGVGEEDVKELAQYHMMLAEARLARNASQPVVMLDGPLIDPPLPPRGQPTRRLLGNYHVVRAQLLREALTSRLVVGYVKTPKTTSLSRLLGFKGLGDAELGELILSEIISDGACGAWIGTLKPTAPVLDYYEPLGIGYAIVKLRWWKGVRGVEAPAKLMEYALNVVAGWTPKGVQHPVPVLVAHHKASAPRNLIEGFRMLLALEEARTT